MYLSPTPNNPATCYFTISDLCRIWRLSATRIVGLIDGEPGVIRADVFAQPSHAQPMYRMTFVALKAAARIYEIKLFPAARPEEDALTPLEMGEVLHIIARFPRRNSKRAPDPGHWASASTVADANANRNRIRTALERIDYGIGESSYYLRHGSLPPFVDTKDASSEASESGDNTYFFEKDEPSDRRQTEAER